MATQVAREEPLDQRAPCARALDAEAREPHLEERQGRRCADSAAEWAIWRPIALRRGHVGGARRRRRCARHVAVVATTRAITTSPAGC